MSVKYKAPAVKKAFQILKLVSNSERGLSISDLAKSLGISKGTVHGIAAILDELGVIARDPLTKRYELGLTLFELGRRAYSHIDLRETARPAMEDLMEKVQETVFLGTLNREHVTILDVVEPGQDFKITAPVGTTIAFFTPATGKAFLSAMEEREALEKIGSKGLPKYTDQSITDPEKYMHEVREARKNGYALDDEEYISGVRAVAALINGEKDRKAAIWVVGFKASLNKNKMEVLKREIGEAISDINRKIGEKSGLQVGAERS